VKDIEFVNINHMEGKVIKSINGLGEDSDEVIISTECGRRYTIYHEQSCCEQVYLCDFESDSDDFSGAIILSAEEINSENEPEPYEYCDSYTWTFYKIETSRGGIFMRWLGESNGYYSEQVDIKVELI
jgi:hypothetical protein